MTVESLTAGSGGWQQASPAVFEQASQALVATAGAIQQVITRRDATLQALTTGPAGWTGQASQQFTAAWTRRREELQRQMVTQQDASIVYRRFATTLTEAQQAWQRLAEQAAQAGAVLTPEGTVDPLGPPPAAAALALSDDVRAIRTQAEAINTQIMDADRQAAAQLSELARRDPRPEVDDTTNLPVLLHAGMRGQISDTPLPPGTDPSVVAAWFAALSPQMRQRLVQAAPNLMGNLNGLPPEVRDQANRSAIAAALATVREDGAPDRRISTFEQLLALGPDHKILAFSPEENGRVAIAVGDITTAENVGVIVPGMDTTIDKYGGYVDSAEALRLTIEEQFNPTGESDTAMVAWLDYDAPQGLWSTLNPFNGYPAAQAGAPRLAEFTEGLMVTHEGDPHLTVAAHSYGSSTTSLAAVEYGLPADEVILYGSTGALGAEHASDFNLQEHGEVWAARNKNDIVGEVPEAILGIEPIHKDFGANVFQADDEVLVFNEFGHASSHYLDPGSSPSHMNFARIIADRSEEVELGVHRFGYLEQP